MATTETIKEEKKISSLYSPELLDRASASAGALDDLVANRPADYSSQYQPQIDMAMDKVLNRPDFKYDVNQDALYQQYKDRYTQMGKQAMQDTMGQAAALTGGYGSTYGQRVGQQTYDQYMQGLTDKIPELYQMAMEKYDRDYAYDKDRLAVLDAADQKDYGRWGDNMSLWQGDRSYLAGRYDTELAQSMAAGEQMYSRLAAMIQLGYTPTEDEMRAAGMTADHVAALKGQYLPQPSGGGGGGGGASGGGAKKKATSAGQDGDFSLDAASALESGASPTQIQNALVAAGASASSAAASVQKAQSLESQLAAVRSIPKPR